jgi:hypothetical protein
LVVLPQGTLYCEVRVEDVGEIIESHVLKGQVVERLLYRDPKTESFTQKIDEIAFFRNQLRIALRNCGHINPDDVEEYIARDGYRALGKVLAEYKPEDVVMSLRNRGCGAGAVEDSLQV